MNHMLNCGHKVEHENFPFLVMSLTYIQWNQKKVPPNENLNLHELLLL